jgi:hypothetical protein
MNWKKFSLPLSLFGAACITLGAELNAQALTFSEPPDAGPLLSSAADTTVVGIVGNDPLTNLTTITGSLARNADLYRIQVTTGLFEAIAVGIGRNPVEDTQLFLFDQNGRGIMANDDNPSGGLGSRIRQFLTAGIYYLGISSYNYDPVSGGGPLANRPFIFPSTPFTALVGPTGPGGANPLSGWRGTIFENPPGGRYEINLRTVPTPALLPGLLALGAGVLRKGKDEMAEEGSEA